MVLLKSNKHNLFGFVLYSNKIEEMSVFYAFLSSLYSKRPKMTSKNPNRECKLDWEIFDIIYQWNIFISNQKILFGINLTSVPFELAGAQTIIIITVHVAYASGAHVNHDDDEYGNIKNNKSIYH